MIVLVAYLTVIAAAGIIVENLKSKQAKRIYLKLTFIFAFLYSGLRGKTVGIDTAAVMQIYDNVAQNGLSELPRNTELEKGYMILNWVLSKISLNPQLLLIVMSAIISFGFYIMIRDYSRNYMLSCLIFAASIFTVTMNVSRQYLALAFVFIAVKYASEKKTIRTLLFLMIAGSMHYSALVFLPLVLLSLKKFRFDRKLLAVTGGLSFLAVPFYLTLVSVVTMIFPQYSRFLESARYSQSSGISYAFVIYLFVILMLGLWSILPVYFTGFKMIIQRRRRPAKRCREYNDGDAVDYLFLLMFVEYIVIYFISTKLWIAGRLIYYFQASLIVVLPNILDRLRRGKLGKSAILMELLFIIYYVNSGYHYILSDPHGVLPYVFFWNN